MQLQHEFDQKGYVIVDLLNEEEIDLLRNFFSQFAHLHQTPGFSASMLIPDQQYRAASYEIISGLLSPKLQQIFKDYDLFTCGFAMKAPNTPDAPMELHQDMTFVDETQHTSVNIWCPLVDVNEANGWLGVADGTHCFNPNYREASPFPYPDLLSYIKEHYIHYLPMQAGQALLFHPRLFHGSPGNSTDELRLITVGTVAPRDARLIYCHRDWRNAPHELELFEVTPEFYTHHMIGTRPKDAISLGKIPKVIAPLSEADLERG